MDEHLPDKQYMDADPDEDIPAGTTLTYPAVFKIAKGWALFIYCCAPLLIALFTWLLVMPFTGQQPAAGNHTAWILVPVSIAMIALTVIGVIDSYKAKLVINADRINSFGFLSERELMHNEIKGFRITDKYILIEPGTKAKKTIKVSTYFGNKEQIIQWLASHYDDLDITNIVTSKEEILSNGHFGLTPEQREEKLQRASLVAKIINWCGGLVTLWCFFYPHPYQYAILAAVIIPPAAIAAIFYFGGIIKFEEKDGAYPTVFPALLIPGLALVIRAVMDYNIFDNTHAWLPSIIITVALTALLIISSRQENMKQRKTFIAALAMSIFLLAYSYGTVITLNAVYDLSPAQVYKAAVIKKRISSGKSTTYYLAVTPWGPEVAGDEVTVSKELYNTTSINDSVNIYFKKGRFSIPWFEVAGGK